MATSSSHTVQHEATESKGRFFIANAAGDTLAECTYSKAGDTKIIIDHTEVDDSLRGTGAGQALVAAAVAWARAQSVKIVPLCPFAKAVIRKNPEMQGVL